MVCGGTGRPSGGRHDDAAQVAVSPPGTLPLPCSGIIPQCSHRRDLPTKSHAFIQTELQQGGSQSRLLPSQSCPSQMALGPPAATQAGVEPEGATGLGDARCRGPDKMCWGAGSAASGQGFPQPVHEVQRPPGHPRQPGSPHPRRVSHLPAPAPSGPPGGLPS